MERQDMEMLVRVDERFREFIGDESYDAFYRAIVPVTLRLWGKSVGEIEDRLCAFIDEVSTATNYSQVNQRIWTKRGELLHTTPAPVKRTLPIDCLQPSEAMKAQKGYESVQGVYKPGTWNDKDPIKVVRVIDTYILADGNTRTAINAMANRQHQEVLEVANPESAAVWGAIDAYKSGVTHVFDIPKKLVSDKRYEEYCLGVMTTVR